MPSSSPSKPQLAIYAALAIAVLLIGARFLRHGDGGSSGTNAAPAFATTTSSSSAGAPSGLAAGAGAASGAAGATGAQLVVDVKGAVRRPGVYRLPAGARTYDAVRRAGGLTGRADRVGVNLAARVVDGGEVVVPARGAAGSGSAAGTTTASSGGAGGAGAAGGPLSLDLDSATEQQLEQLDGVGPALAAKIVAYREQHGGISSVDELDNVSGIGPAKLAAIRAQLGR
jgi:competence protein ComEA